MRALLMSTNMEVWISLWLMFLCFIGMWYKGKLPSIGELQDLTTILNSRGGNIMILAAASVYFFYRSEHMYVKVIELVNSNKMTADNGIALNGLTFDTGAFGAAFGALLKTMSPDAPSPVSSTSVSSTSTTKTETHPPQSLANGAPSSPEDAPSITQETPTAPVEQVDQTQHIKLTVPIK
jgi:hypothetical protein